LRYFKKALVIREEEGDEEGGLKGQDATPGVQNGGPKWASR